MSRAKGRGGQGRKGKPPAAPPRAVPPEPPFVRPPIALVIAVVLTAVLEVLDMTIVNVSIPHMLGTFAATPDQITWVLTSYIVAAAVVMPLTGYLSNWLGRRRLLLTAIIGFVVSSALCGMSWSLESMVVFRLAQGVFGAPLVPLSQAILLDAFPRSRHGQALAIFGMGIMVAPVIGPALGGYLTENYSWRMVFYINVPLGIFALLMAIGYLPKRAIKDMKTDWVGMGLLVLAVGALQYVLDQGQSRDWFNSRVIVVRHHHRRIRRAPPSSSEAGTRATTSSTCRCCGTGISSRARSPSPPTASACSAGWRSCRYSASGCSAIRPTSPERCSFRAASSAPSPWRSPAASSSACSTPAIS